MQPRKHEASTTITKKQPAVFFMLLRVLRAFVIPARLMSDQSRSL